MRTRRKSQYGASRRRAHHGGEGEETETTTTGEETTTTGEETTTTGEETTTTGEETTTTGEETTTTGEETTTTGGEAPVDIMPYDNNKPYYLGDMVIKMERNLLYRLKNQTSTSEEPTTNPNVWSLIEQFGEHSEGDVYTGVKNYALDDIVWYPDGLIKVAKRVQPAAGQRQYEAGQPPFWTAPPGTDGVIEPNPSAWKTIGVVPSEVSANARQQVLSYVPPLPNGDVILATNMPNNTAVFGEHVEVTATNVPIMFNVAKWYSRTSPDAEWQQNGGCQDSNGCGFYAPNTPGVMSIMWEGAGYRFTVDVTIVEFRLEGVMVKTTPTTILAAGDNWLSYAYDPKAFSGVARVSFSSGFDGNEENPNISNIVGGFTETPTDNEPPRYTHLKYGMQINKDGVFIMENGINKAQVANNANYHGDIGSIVYDGTSVKYYWNYVLVYTSTQTQTNPLYAYVTLESGAMRVENFHPKAIGVLEMPATTTAGQEGGGRRRTRSKRRHGRRSSRKRGAQNLRHGKRM